ncbi:unnamed protein product [Paramecium sonneborni]|uniref:Uncharacterized protein n=1 Tax=Paramecium sonneborni TaxID=65129 RepID=A0A8S1MVT2_9CILI|nr:unnamed protein product [Paramecium sonneborni]
MYVNQFMKDKQNSQAIQGLNCQTRIKVNFQLKSQVKNNTIFRKNSNQF